MKKIEVDDFVIDTINRNRKPDEDDNEVLRRLLAPHSVPPTIPVEPKLPIWNVPPDKK